MDSLGSRVKELRVKKGLTQFELGNMSGIHHTNIGRIENKNTIPQADILYQIAVNLDTSVEWLLTGHTVPLNNGSKDLLTEDNISRQPDGSYNEMCQLFTQLDELEKREVHQFIKFLLYEKNLPKS